MPITRVYWIIFLCVIFFAYNIGTYICIYTYKVSCINSFFAIFNCNVFSALYAKHFEIFCEIDEWLRRSPIFRLIVNPFSLLCSIFFLSRKLCFLRSPCLLLITESISLDTFSKPTVRFYLKISSSSSIIFSISLDELNSSDWLLKRWRWVFLK